ncbi:MetS family NSS transporter small subunit [Nitriliruptoraceae bacterium ZYF776]|nr:MetS family NSS transporter small subunit [Profundirhabdus halotolerans]
MSTSAIVMLVLAFLVVLGGFTASVVHAVVSERRDTSSGPGRDT